MAYTKQNFQPGAVLYASQLNALDNELESIGSTYLGRRESLTASTDINTIRQAGYYYKDQGVTIPHGINSNQAKIIMFNNAASGGQYGCVQMWFDTKYCKLYFRTASNMNTAWSAWHEVDAVDDTLLQAGIAADSKATGDAIAAVRAMVEALISPTRNLCDVPLGRYYTGSTTGAVNPVSDTSYWGMSDYIPVTAGETYTISFGGSVEAEYYVIFVRNSDDTKNERLVYLGTGPKTLTIKEGGAKLNVYFRNENTALPDDSWIQIEHGSDATTHVEPETVNDTIARAMVTDLGVVVEDLDDKIDTVEGKIPVTPYQITGRTMLGGMRTGNGAMSLENTLNYSISTKLYKMAPGTDYTVEFDIDTFRYLYVFYYNTDGTLNKYAAKATNPFTAQMPSGCSYISLMSYIQSATEEHEETFTIHASSRVEEVYYPNILSNGFYSLTFIYPVATGVKTSGRLLLPPNYKMSGKKVPLIVFVHGSGGMLQWNSLLGRYKDGAETKTYLPYLQYLANEGFAVFDCYPWTDKLTLTNDTDSPFIIPTHIQAYLSGIRYVCDHFNVDINRVSLLCKSQGGHLGQWAISQSEFPFKCVSLFAPSCGIGTIYPNTNNYIFTNAYCRRALADLGEFVFADDTEKQAFITGGNNSPALADFFARNKTKLVAMNPSVCGMTNGERDNLFIYGTQAVVATPDWMKAEVPSLVDPTFTMSSMYQIGQTKTYVKKATCPSKFWVAFDDDSVPGRSVYACYRYLANGGADTQFRELPAGTGGHHAMDTDPDALKSSGTTALGVTYTDIPTAYVEVVEFIRSKMGG